MTYEELEAYVDKHRNSLIAEAAYYIDQENGQCAYSGGVALCIYFDRWDWPKSKKAWYRIVARPLQETKQGMMEEAFDFYVFVADIRTEDPINANI